MSRPGAWASIRPARDAARDANRLGQDSPARGAGSTTSSAAAAGDWALGVNEHGDLVAEHQNGTVRTIAVVEDAREH